MRNTFYTKLLALAVVCVFSSFGVALAQKYKPVSDTPPSPEREFRAAWVATVYNLDWPSKPGLPPEVQQAQMISILNKLRDLNMNAVLFQVRPQSDALYRSPFEPWAPYLTGSMGGDPGYDPLSFVIAEAHKRGIEVHAWFNPFRALTNSKNEASSKHITRQHPEWIRSYGSSLIVDPGNPKARQYVTSIIMDVVRRYNIDGVHLDDYFYPYKIGKSEFPDGGTYANSGSSLPRTEWRRQNINAFVQNLHTLIKSAKPNVRFGISPFGIWRPGVPAGIEAGVDAYEDLACDGRKWLANGWVDYLSPQLYWSIEPAKQSFSSLLRWWIQQSTDGRPIWPGIATERIGKNRPATEIIRQIQLTRQSGHSNGQIHWQMSALMKNQGGISDLLKQTVYSRPALVPGSSTTAYSPTLEVKSGMLFITLPTSVHPKWVIVQNQKGGKWETPQIMNGAVSQIPLSSFPDKISVQILDQDNVLSAPATLCKDS